MKCKICGFIINEDDSKCSGCDNEIAYLKKHDYIINEEVVDKKKEKVKLNLVFLLPVLILIIIISLYVFWIKRNIPILTNNIVNKVISNMKDNISYLNLSLDDINLHISKDINKIDDNDAYYINDEINTYRYDKYDYIEDIEGVNPDLIKVFNYLFNEGEIKKVFTFIKDNIKLSKYKIKYGTVFHNEHNMLSIKFSYNINNISDIIKLLEDNYLYSLSKIWNLNEDDTLTKLNTYYKNVKLNIYTDILTRHIYKIEIDIGSILELDIMNNKISGLKYIGNNKTITFKDSVVIISTSDKIETIKYNYNKYMGNDLSN